MLDVVGPLTSASPFPLRTVLAGLTIIAGLLAWQADTDRRRSDGMPADLHAIMTYESMAGDSFLPSSNKTLLRVFVIPLSVAATIAERKQSYLEAQFADDGYAEWRETPVVLDDRWPAVRCECVDPTEGPIGAFLEKSVFHIPVDPEVERSINEALLVPGSYYAYGVHNLLLVIPSRNVAVYAFVK
jgi:hypothetical protein